MSVSSVFYLILSYERIRALRALPVDIVFKFRTSGLIIIVGIEVVANCVLIYRLNRLVTIDITRIIFQE